MMETVRAFAPGKAFVVGEYAVLDGAPGLVWAVDRYATVRVVPAKDYRISLVPLGVEHRFKGKPDFDELAPQLRVHTRVVENAWRTWKVEHPVHIFINTSDFYEHGRKIGLGSSAAVSVAAYRAFSAAQGSVPGSIQERMQSVMQVHAQAMGKRGSGGDVAAAFVGGLVRYERREDAVHAQAIPWPKGLHGCLVNTKSPSDTGRYVDAFWRYWNDPKSDALRRSLHIAARTAVDAFIGDAGGAVAATSDFGEALRELQEESGMPIWSEPHNDIATVAEATQVGYKPSGAGGGDIGIAVSAVAESLDEFARLVQDKGYEVIHCGQGQAAGLGEPPKEQP